MWTFRKAGSRAGSGAGRGPTRFSEMWQELMGIASQSQLDNSPPGSRPIITLQLSQHNKPEPIVSFYDHTVGVLGSAVPLNTSYSTVFQKENYRIFPFTASFWSISVRSVLAFLSQVRNKVAYTLSTLRHSSHRDVFHRPQASAPNRHFTRYAC